MGNAKGQRVSVFVFASARCASGGWNRRRLDWPRDSRVETKRYEEKLKSVSYLIAVHVHDDMEEDRAEEIFKAAGGEEITSSSMSSAPKEEAARA